MEKWCARSGPSSKPAWRWRRPPACPASASSSIPGIGFAKRAGDSIRLLARLDDAVFVALDRPLLVGPSRKSFLRVGLGDRPPGEREWGTAAAVTACILAGAHIVRVHGVEAMTQVARVADSILAARTA